MVRTKDGFPPVPQFIGHLCITTKKDEDIEAAKDIVRYHLRVALTDLQSKGYDCKINFGKTNY